MIITGNRIAVLGKSGEVSVPQNSQVIDATGKFLIPGLCDMHTHTVYDRADDTEKTLLPLLLANGITGIRTMGSINSLAQINKWRNSAAEELPAPRVIIGQQVDGFGGINVSFVYRVKGASDARAAVRRIKREGFDFVKFTVGFPEKIISLSLMKPSCEGIPLDGFALKVRNHSWIGSVQGAVATWSVIGMRYFQMILNFHRLTRSLPLPVLTRSKYVPYF